MRETFGVNKGGGIRPSSTSTDIILVRNVHSDYGDAEEGGRIIYDGKYYGGPSQMISGNLKLAESQKNGNRILYFVKEDGQLVFNGQVEYVRHYDKNDPSRPGAIAHVLEMVGAGAADAAGAADRRRTGAGRPAPRASSAPDLDMIMEVERIILDRRRLTSRSELLAALHMGIDSAKLDRILEYLERSAKISTGDGSIRWTFGGGAAAAGSVGEESAGILSRAEQLSADLDNDLPYSAEIERSLADCEAGRPIGKTYTAEEYLRLLDQEFGTDAKDSVTVEPPEAPAPRAGRTASSARQRA